MLPFCIYLGSCQVSMMEFFLLTIFEKIFISGV